MKHFTVRIFSSQPYDTDALASECMFLKYSVENHGARQAILKNRLVGMPQLELKEYKCRAVFDWMEILVDLPKQVYTGDVGRLLKARMSEQGKGGARVTDQARKQRTHTDQLLIRLHDPSLKRFGKMFSILGSHYRLPRSGRYIAHRIADFELSVDFYPRESAVKDEDDRILRRIRMSELLRKHFAPLGVFINKDFSDPEDRLQYHDGSKHFQIRLPSGPRKKTSGSGKELENIRAPLLGGSDPARHKAAPINATVYVGKKNRDLHYRLQDKTGDMRNESGFQELSARERRSRIEYTLFNNRSGGETIAEELGIYSVSDIAHFKWQAGRKDFFGFELPTFSRGPDGQPDPEEIEIFRKTGCFGLKLFHQGQREIECARGIRDETGRLLREAGSKGYNKSFSKLNQKVWKAMRAAGKSFAEG